MRAMAASRASAPVRQENKSPTSRSANVGTHTRFIPLRTLRIMKEVAAMFAATATPSTAKLAGSPKRQNSDVAMP